MKRRVKLPNDEPAVTNAALELFRISTKNGRYAFTYIDSSGVIEHHRFVEVAQEAAQWAHLMRRHGLELGERIIVLAGRDRHWRSALLGVVEAGGVAVPCPASTPIAQIRSLAAASRAVRALSALPRPDLAATAGTGVLCARDLEPRQTAYAHADVAYPTRPEDFAVIVNGHDGADFRGAAYTHNALLEQASSGARRLGVREGECVWSTVSEGSAASVWLALAAWHLGVQLVVVEDELAPQAKLELLDILKPAAVWFSDEEYAALAAADAPAWMDLSSIRQAMTSGEPADGAIAFQEAFGVTAVAAPVSTEVVGVAADPEPAEPPAPTAQRPTTASSGAKLVNLRPVRRLSEDEIIRRREELAAAKAPPRATQAAAHAEAPRRAEEARRPEEERLRQEKEARRREEQEVRERRNEDKRRGEEEAKQRKLAEKSAHEAAQTEERRRGEEEKTRERAARATAEQQQRSRKAPREAALAEERRPGAWLEDVRAGGGDGSLECRRCGATLPDDANYCVRCGEGIRSEAGPGAPAAAGEECTIVWWRGYVQSGFFAVATGGRARSAEPEPLGSSLFRSLGGGAPVPEGRALEAHRALVERMQSEGWDPVGRGAHWYETRFRRTPGLRE